MSHMKLHRFITTILRDDDVSRIVDPAILHQVKRVLRHTTGDIIVVVDETGTEYQFKIHHYEPQAIVGTTSSLGKTIQESAVQIFLYCSILKRENFELVVQKVTEIGVTDIIPLICDRTVKLGVKHDRLLSIAKEAAEQSGRLTVPHIHEIQAFGDVMKNHTPNDLHYFFDLHGDSVSALPFRESKPVVHIYVGPEGGWTDQERTLARESDCNIVSLGRMTLRAETAAIIATYGLVKQYSL